MRLLKYKLLILGFEFIIFTDYIDHAKIPATDHRLSLFLYIRAIYALAVPA